MSCERWLPRVLMLLALAAGLVLGYLQIQPSLPLPEGFAPEAHSLDRAGPVPDLNRMLRHVEAMAQAPHPSGSEALAACQAYLREQLGRMGYACQADSHELTVDDVLLMDQRRVAGGGRDFELTREDIRENLDLGERERFTIRNLWVRVDAPDTDELILFVAHTDSTRYGPGAFDDTVAVASMLEALRLLKEAPLRRDLLFLFTDGEEQLMLGRRRTAAALPGASWKTPGW